MWYSGLSFPTYSPLMYLVVNLNQIITQSTPPLTSKVTQKVTSSTGLALEPRNKYYELPFHVSPDFTGGNQVCRKLRENCLPSGYSTARISQRIFTLYGLGGSGKTQMALKFASDYRERYKNIFTLFCARRTLHDFANACQASGEFSLSTRAVPTWLNKVSQRWPKFAK